MKPAEQFSSALALIFMRWPLRRARPHPALLRIRDRLIRSRFCQTEERREARTGSARGTTAHGPGTGRDVGLQRYQRDGEERGTVEYATESVIEHLVNRSHSRKSRVKSLGYKHSPS
jgi:hypothetical protein